MPRSWLLLRGIPSSGPGPGKYKMSLEHQVVSAGRRLRRTKEGGRVKGIWEPAWRVPSGQLQNNQVTPLNTIPDYNPKYTHKSLHTEIDD